MAIKVALVTADDGLELDMQMSRKLSNGLAWAGVVVVVGVLCADFVTSKFMSSTAAQATELSVQTAGPSAVTPMPASARPKPVAAVKPAMQPVKPVAAVPVATATQVKSNDVVDRYMSDGKALPSYLTDGPAAAKPVAVKPAAPAAQAVSTPAIAAGSPVAADPIQVGAIAPPALAVPAKIAPVPLPLSLRPKPMQQPPLVIDAPTIQANIVPPQDLVAKPLPVAQGQDQIVSAQDLQDWESGPLSEFLAKRRGGTPRSSANYDPDGFYLGDGPNSSGAHYIGPVYDDGGY